MQKNATIQDLIPDDKNFNQGSEEGSRLMKNSLGKFGAARSILIDKNNRIIAGNKTIEAAEAVGLDDVLIVESDGKKIIAVKRTDVDLDSPEGRELALADNATAKANIILDVELIEAELGELVCMEWGLGETVVDEKKAKDKTPKWVPDCLFPSNNEYDIPTLLHPKKNLYVELPFKPWGADARTKTGIGTYHFYVDDYRFEAIWDDPSKIIQSGCKAIVEPNLSLYETTPTSYGIFLIYKKRWIARFLQDYNIDVFVDLNVTEKFMPYNILGVPDGYNAFFTRGYDNRLKALQMEFDIAREISGLDQPNFIVYGGSKKVKDFCNKNNLIFINNTTLDL